jgi:hypothetical protein
VNAVARRVAAISLVHTPSGPKPRGERRKELLARFNAHRRFTDSDTAKGRGQGNRTNHPRPRRKVVVAANEWTPILSGRWGK